MADGAATASTQTSTTNGARSKTREGCGRRPCSGQWQRQGDRFTDMRRRASLPCVRMYNLVGGRCMTRPSQPTPCPEAVMLPPSRSFRRLRAPSLRPAMRDNTMSRRTFVGARHQWSAQNRGRLRAGAKQHHRLRDTHSRKTSEEREQRGLKGPRKQDEHAKQY